MKSILKNKLSSFIYKKTPIGDLHNGLCDIYHYRKYSFKEKNLGNDKSHLRFYLTKHYHIIEKGLALPEPRYGFGQPKILDLIQKSENYRNLYGEDKLIHSIKKTLSEYLLFHESNSYTLPEEFTNSIKLFIDESYETSKKDSRYEGGVKVKTKNNHSNIDYEQFKTFVESRASVRNFSNEEVPIEVIESIVETSRSAPSVCNRQAWKAHYFSDKNKIREILSYQNGNLGFRDVINKLIIVTTDVKGFTRNEHNQIFIDGGLFSQNLLLAIHAAGLGACPLNTCYTFRGENKVKVIANIPKNERLIMMIAVGALKDEYKVAYSPRNPTEDVLIKH